MASSSRPTRAVATLSGTLVLALAAIGLAVAAPGSGAAPRAELSAASGAVRIANSRAGQALFSAGGARPGETSSGTVTIGNDGDVPGRFALARTGLSESAGAHGGLLSQQLRVVVLDVTDPSDPELVFDEEADKLGNLPLGIFEPGEERTYRVQATLPDGGLPASATVGDNRFQGATLSLGLQWQATAVGGATPTPTPTATPTPTPTPRAPAPVPPAPTPAPAPTTPPAATGTLGLPTGCVNGGKLKLKLKPPAGTTVLTATVSANGRVAARLKGAKTRKPFSLSGLRGSRAKVSVSAKASDGLTYVAARTYKTCKR
jgi:hypothetical protein